MQSNFLMNNVRIENLGLVDQGQQAVACRSSAHTFALT